MRRKCAFHKIFALALSAILCFVFLPAGAENAFASAYGEEVTQVSRDIRSLCSPQQVRIVNSGGAQQQGRLSVPAWKGDYVYMGTLQGKPIKWRVLDTTGSSGSSSVSGGILLQSDKVLDNMQFTSQENDESWEKSDIRAWLKEVFPVWFTRQEQAAVMDSSLAAASSAAVTWLKPTAVNGDKLFLLDVTDVQNAKYGYLTTDTGNRWWNSSVGNLQLKDIETEKAVNWWLRSGSDPVFTDGEVLGNNDPAAGIAAAEGYMTWTYADYNAYGVAPALNLDIDKVVMVTQMGTSKAKPFHSVPTVKAGGNNWCLTMEDGTELQWKLKGDAIVKPGGTLTIEVTGLPTGNQCTYSQLSAILSRNTDGAAAAYGKISDLPQKGTVEITIPSDLTEGDYMLSVFAEDVHSSGTSYASRAKYAVAVGIESSGGGTEEETGSSMETGSGQDRIINGVKSTTIRAQSVAGKGYIKVSWTKSKGYKVDCYQIWKSVKKSSGFRKTFKTSKTSYKNTKGLKKGTRYYYKVRGMRTIDGTVYYTRWSNVTYKTAR